MDLDRASSAIASEDKDPLARWMGQLVEAVHRLELGVYAVVAALVLGLGTVVVALALG